MTEAEAKLVLQCRKYLRDMVNAVKTDLELNLFDFKSKSTQEQMELAAKGYPNPTNGPEIVIGEIMRYGMIMAMEHENSSKEAYGLLAIKLSEAREEIELSEAREEIDEELE